MPTMTAMQPQVIYLTARQAEVYEAMLRHQRKHKGQAATVRGLQSALGIGSTNGVLCHLKPLMRKGLVEQVDQHYRAIPQDGRCPACGQCMPDEGEVDR